MIGGRTIFRSNDNSEVGGRRGVIMMRRKNMIKICKGVNVLIIYPSNA